MPPLRTGCALAVLLNVLFDANMGSACAEFGAEKAINVTSVLNKKNAGAGKFIVGLGFEFK